LERRQRSGVLSSPILDARDTTMLGTMGATKHRPIGFDAVPNYSAIAVLAVWRQGVNCTFKAIERVAFARDRDLERFVVVIPTNFAAAHRVTP
jgi:hypothetical protein